MHSDAPTSPPAPEPQPTSEAQLPQTPETASATPATAAPAGSASRSPDEVAAALKALFPAVFASRSKPLKLRIQADIQARAPGEFSKAQLSQFLRRHTGSTTYLVGITQAKTRFDLDGQPADEITDEHRSVAREELARRRGLQQERQALEDQQRRNRAQLLYDFERTTLTEGNFCALKGVSAEELPGLLEIARKERAERPPEPRRDGPRPPQRDGRKPGPDRRNAEPGRRGPRPQTPKPRENA